MDRSLISGYQLSIGGAITDRFGYIPRKIDPPRKLGWHCCKCSYVTEGSESYAPEHCNGQLDVIDRNKLLSVYREILDKYQEIDTKMALDILNVYNGINGDSYDIIGDCSDTFDVFYGGEPTDKDWYGDTADELKARESEFITKITCGCTELKWYSGTHTLEEIEAHKASEEKRESETETEIEILRSWWPDQCLGPSLYLYPLL